ncbi:MAG TPA: hypothetical protein DD761_08165 [Cyanobacteria bacterium UBA11691]|nr:hypothetical protein [Cyanobacteria bacterium UBA11691]
MIAPQSDLILFLHDIALNKYSQTITSIEIMSGKIKEKWYESAESDLQQFYLKFTCSSIFPGNIIDIRDLKFVRKIRTFFF